MILKPHRAITAGLGLLAAACGGGGPSSPTPVPTPAPVPAPNSPSPAPAPAGSPKDFQLVYAVPGQGLFTLPANTLSARPTLRSSAQPLLARQIFDGEWANGVPVNSRPHSLVYLDGSQWRRFSLRSGENQAVSDTGPVETRVVCTENAAVAFPDYSNPLNSLVFYSTAGSDGSCGTTDDLYAVFRPGSATLVNLGTQPPLLRQFRDDRGAFTGYLMQVGNELRLYSADSSRFTTLATGIVGAVRNAAQFARTLDTAWLRWDNGSTRAVKVTAAGASPELLFSVPSADTLGLGMADPNALYLPHRPRGATQTQIVRVPYTGSSATIGTVGSSVSLEASTTNSLLLREFGVGSTANGTQVDRYLLLAKSGGTAQVLGQTLFLDRKLVAPSVTEGSQYLVNFFSEPSSGQTSTAAAINEQGQTTESFTSSEWIGDSGDAFSLARQVQPLVNKAARVESCAGSLTSQGHRGGTVVIRDFKAGTRANVAQVTADGILDASSTGLPVALATFTTTDGSNVDLFGYDLETLSFSQVTNSPGLKESLP